MVAIEPIKNQYLTALKERQQIIDKVNEIIKDLNNLNFDDLINLNNKIEQIKTEIAQIENDLSGKVNKNGDTMTGALTLQQSGWNNLTFKHTKYDALNPSGGDERFLNICAYDVNTKITTSLTTSNNTNNVRTYLASYGYKSDGARVSSEINIFANRDGTAYATAPSWSSGTNDNSDKILTIKMANSLPSLVHTTGNETINGTKTFASRIVEQKSSDMGVEMLSTTFDRNATITSYQRPVQFIARDKNGESVMLLQTYAESNNRRGLDLMMYDMSGAHCELSLKSDGSKTYASAPSTPSNSTSNEIATANWVISKINELATKNNLAGL